MLPTRRVIGLGAAALVTISLAVSAAASVVGAAQTTDVRVVREGYQPTSLTIPAGTQVRFMNADTDIHTATSRTGAFDSNLLFPGDSYTFTFDAPGTYEYFCLPHPLFGGTIVVE